MNAIYFMIPFALLLGFGFVVAFIVMARQGQYDDLETPAHRILLDEIQVNPQQPQQKSMKGNP